MIPLSSRRPDAGFSQFPLAPSVQRGVAALGFTEPREIQVQTIPAALEGRDVMGLAQTGTGKTAAFVLPILQRLSTKRGPGPRALILAPTRELAMQIQAEALKLAQFTGLQVVTIFGGVSAGSQIRALRARPDILVACPGRLLDLMRQGVAKLNNIEVLVLDEVDHMFDMGFLPDVKRIIRAVPAKRQTMLFSATFPAEVELLAGQSLTEPQKIAMGISKPAITVAHALYPVPQHLKSGLLLKLLKQTDTDSVLIFTRTKHRAEKLARQIAHAGHRLTSLHSNRTQGQREQALSGFKNGHFHIMVATDIAARGLDVESISHVINFDMPDTADAYIHRIGRTGRAQRTGDAFTFVTPEDNDMIRQLERIMGGPIKRETFADFDYSPPAPPRSGHERREGTRPPRPAPTPKSYGRNRLAPRRSK